MIYNKCIPIPDSELLTSLTPAIQEYFSLFWGDVDQQLDRVINYFRIRGKLNQIDLMVPGGPNSLSIKNCTLVSASESGHLEIVLVLLSTGANVHAMNDCSLRWACENGHLEIVRVLLSSGADVHAHDDYALEWASGNGHLEIVRVLLSSGADVHAKNDQSLRVAIWKSFRCCCR